MPPIIQQYKHDCKECRLLGNDRLNEQPVDVYFCPSEQPTPTIIVRFGDEEHQYHSCDVFTLKNFDSPVGKVMKRHYRK